MDRTPPAKIRKQLRKEVGFGCPIENCGKPFLSYHHFNPPFHIKEHHLAQGMIALCLEHHKMADKNAFSISQLKECKKNPFLKKTGQQPMGKFYWKREQLVLLAGSNLVLCQEVMLKHGGRDIAWLTRDKEGHELLNLDIYGSSGKPILSMRDNDWVIHKPIIDISCSTSGHLLSIVEEKQKLKLSMRFDACSKTDLIEQYKTCFSDKDISEFIQRVIQKTVEDILSLLKTDELVLCTIEGNLVYPTKVELRKAYIQINGGRLSGNISSGNVGAGMSF